MFTLLFTITIIATLSSHLVYHCSPLIGLSASGLASFPCFSDCLSNCSLYLDPHHDDLYLNASSFLALINGERDHPNATAWRKNFLRVGRLVLIGGPDDGVITPWQSR